MVCPGSGSDLAHSQMQRTVPHSLPEGYEPWSCSPQIGISRYTLSLGSASFLVAMNLSADNCLAGAQVLTSAPLARCPRVGSESLFLPPLAGDYKSPQGCLGSLVSQSADRRGCTLVIPGWSRARRAAGFRFTTQTAPQRGSLRMTGKR